MKLMLIDGNSIVNRAFFGIRALNAPDGTPTNGIYGFLTILERLLHLEKPDGLVVTFDLHAPTFRHLQYADYKGTRKGMPEELQVQMPILKLVFSSAEARETMENTRIRESTSASAFFIVLSFLSSVKV